MERNEVLKKAINQNCEFGKFGFCAIESLEKSIDVLSKLKNSCAKAKLCDLIKSIIMTNWKGQTNDLKVVIREINYESGKGYENGKLY